MNKPYDVHEPISLSGAWVRPLCATMWMFSHISTEKHREGQDEVIDPPEIERLLFADVSHLQSSYPVQQQNFEDITEGKVTAPAECEEEDLVLSPPHVGDIELGLKRQESGMDALPSLSNSNGNSNQSARTFISLSDGSSVARYAKEANSILNNEMCPETGFGPKQERIHFRKRYVSQSSVANNITPPVQINVTRTRLTRWRLACPVLRENQHIWGQYAAPYKRIPEVEAGCPIHEFRVSDLNTNFVDPQSKNWPGDDLLGREDKLLRSLLLSLVTAVYGGIHSSAFMSLRTIGSRVMQHANPVEVCRVFALFMLAIPLANLAVCACVTYVFARSYLVVEALFSLRQLPINAYETPRVVQSIPHL